MSAGATRATPAAPVRSQGLRNSLWPADHGDAARRKFVLDGGLPRVLDASRIRILENTALPAPQWLYTRDADELFVYGALGAWRHAPYFAKVDSQTLALRQKRVLPRVLYMGGALVHSSGDVFLVHGCRLHRFRGGDLQREQGVWLPHDNGSLTHFNGLTVTDDGMLVMKGWSLTAAELMVLQDRLLDALPGLAKPVAAARSFAATALFGRALQGAAAGIDALLARLGVSERLGEFLQPQQPGWLLLVNPETLQIEQQLRPPERLPFARMSLAPDTLAAELGEEAAAAEHLVVPGERCIHRWHYRAGHLQEDPAWRERYREPGNGSFVGTGPAIWRQRAFYTDNTAPIGVAAGLRAFCKRLGDHAPQHCVSLGDGEPGFMFWSSAVDPLRDLVFTWDSANGWLEARDAGSFERRWRRSLCTLDGCSVQATHGHLYATDNARRFEPVPLLGALMRGAPAPQSHKDFVVLDTATGEERLRIGIGTSGPSIGMIVPGFHDDVFVPRTAALVRITQSRASP